MQVNGEVGGSWACIALPLWLSDVLRIGVVFTTLMQTVRSACTAFGWSMPTSTCAGRLRDAVGSLRQRHKPDHVRPSSMTGHPQQSAS